MLDIVFLKCCFFVEVVTDSEGKDARGHEFFGTKAYLTVSGQLHAEMMATALGYELRIVMDFEIIM